MSWSVEMQGLGGLHSQKATPNVLEKSVGTCTDKPNYASVLSSANLTLWALTMVYLNLRANKKIERLLRPILRPAGPQHLQPTRKMSRLQIQWSHWTDHWSAKWQTFGEPIISTRTKREQVAAAFVKSVLKPLICDGEEFSTKSVISAMWANLWRRLPQLQSSTCQKA
jgi:hypothetical protein